MESEQASAESQNSLGGSSYDSSSSIKEREDIVNSLQDKIKVLLKSQKHNAKYKQSFEDLKKKIDQYRNTCKDLQEQIMEIIHCLDLPEDSPNSTILEKIKSLREFEILFQKINDIINDQNNSNKKAVISIIKDSTMLRRTISEILGKDKSSDELISEIKQLKKAKKIADSTLKELGTNNFEYIIENQKEIEEQQQQICSLLDVKNINNKNARHINIISAIKGLKLKPNEILNEISQYISPDMTEKIDDIQDVKNMIDEIKQKSNKLNKQNELLTTELQKNKQSLSQLHFTNADEATSIISDLLSTLSIKSPAMIQNEISKKIHEKEDLISSNKTISEELQKIKSKLNETKSSLQTKEVEYEEIQSKLNDFQQKCRKIENEKNTLKNSLDDKDEEINSLKTLLQTEKGNVKLKFDEFNEQISSLKSDIRTLQNKNDELNSKNKELTNDLQNANEQLETTKKSMKEQIEANNGLIEKVGNLSTQFEQTKTELDSLKETHESLETKFKQSKQKTDNLQKILNADDSDQISTQIQVMLSEIEELKNLNEDLNKERQNIIKLLDLTNQSSISEAISDLLESQAEQKAENQDLTQKISAIASFLNIPEPQTATLATIQKTIRNLQKELETEQKENLKIKNENDGLNQKYDVLLDTQNEIQKSLNVDGFQSSNDLIRAVSQNEKLISDACNRLNVNKDDFLNKVNSNNELISELCRELNTDESNLIQTVRNNKKSIEKAAQILNTSGSNIENVIEDNNEVVNKICKTLNCNKEKVADQVQQNNQVLNDLLKQADCNQIDQLSNEFKKTKQTLNEALNKLNIDSYDKVASTLESLKKDAKKAALMEEKTAEISGLLNIQNGKGLDDVKCSIHELMSENKQLNDTISRIQSIMNSNDILNSTALMATVFNSIQKNLPKSTDLNEIPMIFGHYQKDSEAYKKIQQLFPSRDPLTEINSLQNELNEIHSIFNMDKFDDPIELIKLNNDFVRSTIEIVNGSSKKSQSDALNSVNSQDLINTIQKTFKEHRAIMNLLKTDSPLNSVKSLINQKEEISQLVNMDGDEETKDAIQKVIGLKNNLTSLFDVDEASDIFTTVQNQKQANTELFNILNVHDSNELISKATELAEIERLIKKFYPDDQSCKDAILRNEKEKKEMNDFIAKLSTLFKSSSNSSANSSNSSIHSNQSINSKSSKGSKSSNYSHLLRKIHRMVKLTTEVCQLLNCSEKSLIDRITQMKNELESFNEVFNSEATNDESKAIHSAKEEKQILKNLKQTVNVNKYSEIIPRVNQYQSEIKELQEKLKQADNLKSKLNSIFDISNNLSSSVSIEKRAEEFRSKLDQFGDLISLMNCNEDEVKSLIINLLNATNSSSIKEIPNYILMMKEKLDRLTQKIQKDNSMLAEFLNSDNDIQFMNSDNIVQLTLNKFKQKISSMESYLNTYDNEINRHANFIKNSNQHYSLDEIKLIFKSHEDQLRQLICLFSNNNNNNRSSDFNDISMIIQKVEELKMILNETTNELTKCQQIIKQRNYELSAILSACQASSPEFVIDIINSLKKQISELNKEVAELKTCQIVEESFRTFEKKENKNCAIIASKLNEINNLLQTILYSFENGRTQKAEMKRLIEGALMESINLREKLENNEEKWMLFGSQKKTSKKLTLSDEIRIKKKELSEQKRKADKAEMTVYTQQQNVQEKQQKPKVHQYKQPSTLL